MLQFIFRPSIGNGVLAKRSHMASTTRFPKRGLCLIAVAPPFGMVRAPDVHSTFRPSAGGDTAIYLDGTVPHATQSQTVTLRDNRATRELTVSDAHG